MGGMGLTNESVAIIHVTDINNHAPQFSPATVSLIQLYIRDIFNRYLEKTSVKLLDIESFGLCFVCGSCSTAC